MNNETLSIKSPEFLQKSAKPGWLDRFARRIVLGKLARLHSGEITIVENDRQQTFGRSDASFPVHATIDVKSPAFYGDIAFGGSIGACEAYVQDYWETSDPVALGRILLRNRSVLDRVEGGVALLSRPLQKAFHWFNRNTRKGSRRNISAHYDLGNEFYELWLDPRMMYSCAWYEDESTTLEEASVAKLDRICQRLDLGPGDRVVEIGSGWGGFAMHAAGKYGCHVTTTTISGRQYEYARRRIEDAGLADRIKLLKKDYRDLEGKFDKLVSIEMIEAVGHEYLDTFFRKCSALLKPAGEALIQSITVADQRYEFAKRNVDFIKRYVFPGGFLPSVTAMTSSMTRTTDMRAVYVEDIGPHYAQTLRDWRARFSARIDDVRKQGYSEEFIRLWDFYLSYCESAFIERTVGDVHLHAIKPHARPSV
jgi:cyclopropane-fatty-acyl-phospholipid synthase